MKLCFKFLAFFILFILLAPVSFSKTNENEVSLRGLKGYETQAVDASKNARQHCNMGNIYFEEGNYIAALKEYEIAYNLTSKTNMSAIYLYNISRCYIMLGDYRLAQNAISGAINKDCMNITYYDTLAECYVKRKIYNEMLKKLYNDTKNPYNRIIIGLIYLKTGNKTNAKITFDEFINDYPRMMITDDIRLLLNRIR